ncbi:uncharacterized protein RJT21DRAFT_10214 [Scheffersomyces amazonensis]|uniref:uncharacterized protein n=1 Tax=Scheffersomyces amazonensis TaxID=1078765 RepID=UPI00315CB4CD
MSSYDNNNPNNTYHHLPYQTSTSGGAPPAVSTHSLKDATSAAAGYDNQPRFYSSPVVIQQPSYYPANGQYTYNQSMIYPPQPGANAYAQQQQQQPQQPPQQQQQPQQQQSYFDPSMPINNYLLIPQGTNPNNTNNQNTGAGNPLAQANYYNTASAYGQYHPPPQMQVSTSLPPKQQQQSHSTGNIPTVSSATSAQQVSSTNSSNANVSTQASSVSVSNNVIFPNFCERLQQLLPPPPLSRASPRPEVNLNLSNKRAKRKSKFSQQQDDLIVSLKKKGKSWVEIAEISNVGSYLAARNRYQVIVGQQGNNNSSSWDNEDKEHLHRILDAGELEKWKFISTELNKATNKNFTDLECREIIRMLFWSNPGQFSVNEDTINECVKEKKLTEKFLEQRDHQSKKKPDHSSSDSSSSSSVSKKRKSSGGNSDVKKEEASTSTSTINSNPLVNQLNPSANAVGNIYYGGAPQLTHNPSSAYQRYSVTPNSQNNAPANQYYQKYY